MIGVIGAGPAGSHVAYLLAKQGHDVQIFEEHTQIGRPCQCTGILTSSFQDIVKPRKDFVVNTIQKYRVFSPNQEHITLNLSKKELILDRPKFDKHMAERAEDVGAVIRTGHQFVHASGGGKKTIEVKDLVDKKRKTVKVDHLIGADGPSSRVARTFGLLGSRTYYAGAQATVKLKMDADTIDTFFGSGFPEFFGWITPEDDTTARIGLATKKNPLHYFNKFLALKKIKQSDILERQGGVIPMYTNKIVAEKDNVYLVGDAALQIKATTGGGILLGLLGAEALAHSIIHKKSYQKEWKRRIGRDLLLHLLMRKILNKFSDTDYNYLTKLCNQKRITRIIEESDREFPSTFLAKLLLNEPRFLYYALKLL